MGGRLPSIRHACETFDVSQTAYRYVPKRPDEDALIADWLMRLPTALQDWGFGLFFLHLRNVKGFGWNHKRVYRIYRELELNLRINILSKYSIVLSYFDDNNVKLSSRYVSIS